MYTCLPNLGDNFIFVAQVLFIYLHGGLIVPWGMYGSPYLPDPARVLYIPPSDLGSVSYQAVDVPASSGSPFASKDDIPV